MYHLKNSDIIEFLNGIAEDGSINTEGFIPTEDTFMGVLGFQSDKYPNIRFMATPNYNDEGVVPVAVEPIGDNGDGVDYEHLGEFDINPNFSKIQQIRVYVTIVNIYISNYLNSDDYKSIVNG